MALPLPSGILGQSIANMVESAVSPSVTTKASTLPFGEIRVWCLQVLLTHRFPGGAPDVLPPVAFLSASVMPVRFLRLALRARHRHCPPVGTG